MGCEFYRIVILKNRPSKTISFKTFKFVNTQSGFLVTKKLYFITIFCINGVCMCYINCSTILFEQMNKYILNAFKQSS